MTRNHAFTPDDRGWPDLHLRSTTHVVTGAHELASNECHSDSGDIVLLDHDIVGKAYTAMLDLVAKHAHAFSLVWRDDLKYHPRAYSLLEELRPFLCHEQHAYEWRGTRLLRSKAWVRWFAVTQSSLSLVAKPESLFAWSGPELPDDMAFYAESGKGWIGSTAHENLCWVDMAAIDRSISSAILEVSRRG